MSRPVRIEFEGALYHVKSKRDEKLYDYNLLPKAYFWIKHQYTIDIKQQHPISPMSYCNR